MVAGHGSSSSLIRKIACERIPLQSRFLSGDRSDLGGRHPSLPAMSPLPTLVATSFALPLSQADLGAMSLRGLHCGSGATFNLRLPNIDPMPFRDVEQAHPPRPDLALIKWDHGSIFSKVSVASMFRFRSRSANASARPGLTLCFDRRSSSHGSCNRPIL